MDVNIFDMTKYLTWQDIKRIVNIADELINTKEGEEMPEYLETEEKYYTEVLNKFKEEYERKK